MLALAAAPAGAAGWRYFEPQPAQPLHPHLAAQDAEGNTWIVGDDGIRRVSPSGESSTLLSREFRSSPQGGYVLPLADGGALVVDGACTVSRVDTTPRLLWQRTAITCAVGVSPDGRHIWVRESGLTKLAPDGRTVHTIPPTNNFPQLRGPVPVLPDGSVISGSESGPDGKVTRYGADATALWTWTNPDARVRFVGLADGAIFVGGKRPRPPYLFDRGDLYLTRLTADGNRVWSLEMPGTNASPTTVMSSDNGTVYALANDSSLLRIDGTGRLVWQLDLCADAQIAMLPSGDIAAACADSTGTGAQFFRVDSTTGTVEETATLPVHGSLRLLALADGHLAVIGRAGPRDEEPGRVIVVDGNGVPVDSALANHTVGKPLVVVNQLLATDGGSYLVTQAADTNNANQHTVSKIGANGVRIWSRTLDDAIADGSMLTAAGGQVCLSADRFDRNVAASQVRRVLECLSSTDGSVRWRQALDAQPRQLVHKSHALDDGDFLFVRNLDSSHEVIRYDGTGTPRASVRKPGGPMSASIDASGRVTLALSDSPTPRIVQYAPSGTEAYSVAMPAEFEALALAPSAMAPDGSVLAFVQRYVQWTNRRSLWSLAPDGSTRWLREVDTTLERADLVRTVGAVFLVQDRLDALDPTRISAIRLLDGAASWSAESVDPNFPVQPFEPRSRIAVARDGRTLVLAATWNDRLRVQYFDAATGERRSDAFVACGEQCSQPGAVAFDANGTARAALTVRDANAGQTGAILTLPAAAETSTRIDQPGIAGAWWAPYANGEGFVLDFLPASRTLFMPWFTFSRDGGNDPAGQRWYVIQGSVAANATSAELPITAATGGAFDAGPPVSPTIVGSATLIFTDCDNGTLQYRFDAAHNGGATGSITLSRLSPATQDCIRADGTTQARTVAPVNGFDARMSGSWYEEATAGQGLQFAVQPGGIFFAPWFTYDPSGTSNDPGRQHWYTIQGSLADARNGVVTLPIVQTIGGTFDRVPTNNMYVVGQATITMLACDRAKLDYRFDDNELAGPVRTRSGSIDLAKAGGCAP